MKRLSLALFCAGMAVVSEGAVLAQRPSAMSQQPSGYRNLLAGPDSDTQESVQGYARQLVFARCMVNVSGSLAADMLETQPNSSSEQRKFTISNDRFSSCKAGSIVTAQSLRRGSVAEALVKKRAKGWVLHPLTADDASYVAFIDAEKPFDTLRESNDRDMINATNCLTAQRPNMVWQILSLDHGSTQEAAEMDALFTQAPSCAGPQRPKALSVSFLRAFLAQSAYRLWLHDSASSAKAQGNS